MRKYLIGVMSSFVLLAVVVQSAQAIPTFARKYRTSCATCHTAFPELNAVGEAFRLNGYRFPDDMYVKEESVSLGQEAYKKVWPNALWPSDIPQVPPISLSFNGNLLNYDTSRVRQVRTQISTLNEADIFSAGTLGDTVSFWAEVNFFPQAAGGTNVAVHPHLNIESLLRDDKLINFQFGYVGFNEIDTPNLRAVRALSMVPYLKDSWTIPSPTGTITGNGDTWTTFTTSAFTPEAFQPGFMFYGFQNRWKYAIGLTSGESTNIDRNSQKDVFFQFCYKFGGLGFDGVSGEKKKDLGSSSSGGWRDDSLSVGLFGYRGTGQTAAVNSGGAGISAGDSFWRLGPDARWNIGDFSFASALTFGYDDTPYGPATNGSMSSQDFIVEGKWFAYPWLIPIVRYESLWLKVPNELVGATVDGGTLGSLVAADGYVLKGTNNIGRVVLETDFLFRANIKFGVWGILYTQNDPKDAAGRPKGDDNMVGASFHFAF